MPTTAKSKIIDQRLRTALAKIIDDHTRTSVRAWATAWDEISGDLEDAIAQLITAQAGGAVTRAQLLRNRRLQKALAVVADTLAELLTDDAEAVINLLRDVVDDAGRTQAKIIAAQLPTKHNPVDIEAWSKVSKTTITAIVKRSTEQITARHYPLEAEATNAVRRELVRGIAAGSNPRETARRMVARAENGFNGGLARATNIARTETLDAHRAGAAAGQEQHADVLVGWVWTAALQPRTCRACLAKDGTVYPLNVPGPNGHQQCRCARVPKTRSWASLGFPELDEPDDETQSAEAYFEGLPIADKQKILGKDGYAAWLAGDFPIEDWAKKRETEGWRDSWVQTTPPKPGGKRKPQPPDPDAIDPDNTPDPTPVPDPTPDPSPEPTPAPEPPAPTAAVDMTDADLVAETEAFMAAGDFDSPRMLAVSGELDRRDQAITELAEQRIRDQEALNILLFGKAAGGHRDLTKRKEGKTADAGWRAEEAIIRDEYEMWSYGMEIAAEEFIRGGSAMTPAGYAKGYTPNMVIARRVSQKWAGEEFQRFLADNQTLTYAEFRASLRDDKWAREAERRRRNRGYDSEFG